MMAWSEIQGESSRWPLHSWRRPWVAIDGWRRKPDNRASLPVVWTWTVQRAAWKCFGSQTS